MFTVGLTGDVGAGKSTLLRVWRELGAAVISADAIAKRQWDRPEVIGAAIRRWGEGILSDGLPDYAKIAGFAFSDRDEFEFTNALIHPFTMDAIDRELEALGGWVVVEIPLLFESGAAHRFDYIVYATADLSQRVRRNAARGWDDAEIERRERFLMSPEEKMRMSDLVLRNDGDIEEWLKSAHEWGIRFMQMAEAAERSEPNSKQNLQLSH